MCSDLAEGRITVGTRAEWEADPADAAEAYQREADPVAVAEAYQWEADPAGAAEAHVVRFP